VKCRGFAALMCRNSTAVMAVLAIARFAAGIARRDVSIPRRNRRFASMGDIDIGPGSDIGATTSSTVSGMNVSDVAAPVPVRSTVSAQPAVNQASVNQATVNQATVNQATVTKAVVPAAGLGTRFLPATKAIPKEMLPVVDKPAIQYVVEEAVAAGLHDVLFVTGRNKNTLENHFDQMYELENRLEEKGDDEKLALVRESNQLARIHYVRQGAPRGLGHAVLVAEHHVGDQPFAVLLGDDIIDSRDPVLPTMIDVQSRYGGSVVALMEVPADQVHLYGCAAVEPLAGKVVDSDLVRITDLVEKPAVGEAPSNLIVIGRYVISPTVFAILRETAPGRGHEIQLTDGLKSLISVPADRGGGVLGVIFRGRRYDTGDRLDYLKATIQLAIDRDDIGPDLASWLKNYVNDEMPS
jgi:UTP--glucose-1-phosphate uridylyltransferase